MTDPLERSHAAMKFAAPDPVAAADWYASLGFRTATYGDYAIVKRGRLCLHLWQCEDRHIAENTSCYVELEDVDTLHAEWAALDLGAGRLEDTPKDQPGHGMREFHLWDPAGNLIGFGSPLKDKPS
jgi:hypothetical protein